MRICIVRHSTAVDLYEAASDDARWRTAEGRARAERGGTLLSERLRPTHVFSSPLVRAVQTAEILSSALAYRGSLPAVTALGPERGTTAQALSVLDELPKNAQVLLVSHEPRVRLLAGQLLAVDRVPGFRTGSACVIDGSPDDGRFAFWVDPVGVRIVETLASVPG